METNPEPAVVATDEENMVYQFPSDTSVVSGHLDLSAPIELNGASLNTSGNYEAVSDNSEVYEPVNGRTSSECSETYEPISVQASVTKTETQVRN